MSLFDGMFDISLETEEEKIARMLNEYALNIVKNKELEVLKDKTYRTPHDNDYIRLYNNLKNLLSYRANTLLPSSFEPIEIVNNSYIAILAIVNNRKCYNEITLLVNAILSLDIDSATSILKELENVEKDNSINIYDKLDYFRKCVENYVEISPVISKTF